MALSRVFPGWDHVAVTGEGAAVGLNGGFLHTAQPGANCLSRPEIPDDVSYEKAPRVP